jgi:hypothetical protein
MIGRHDIQVFRTSGGTFACGLEYAEKRRVVKAARWAKGMDIEEMKIEESVSEEAIGLS